MMPDAANLNKELMREIQKIRKERRPTANLLHGDVIRDLQHCLQMPKQGQNNSVFKPLTENILSEAVSFGKTPRPRDQD